MNNEYPDDYTSPDQEAALEEAIRHRMEEREEAAIARSQALLADRILRLEKAVSLLTSFYPDDLNGSLTASGERLKKLKELFRTND